MAKPPRLVHGGLHGGVADPGLCGPRLAVRNAMNAAEEFKAQDGLSLDTKSAPVTGRRRCRMHGGAAGSGAPTGSRNGNFRHGRYTKEVAATRRWIQEARELLGKLK